MKVSTKGIVEIAAHEGIVPAPYFCSANVLTFGVGHTAAAGDPNPHRMPRAFPTGPRLEQEIIRAVEIYAVDLIKYEDRVIRALNGRKVKQHEFDALVSWDINTGGASFRSKNGQPAQLIQQVRAGDMSGHGFMGWLRPPEIRGRREKELALFRTGHYSATHVPIWSTNGNAKLTRIIGRMPAKELLALIDKAPAPITTTDPARQNNLLATLIAFLTRVFSK